MAAALARHDWLLDFFMIRNSWALRFTCDERTGAVLLAFQPARENMDPARAAFTASDTHDGRSHDLSIRTLFLLCLSPWVLPAQNTGSRFGATNPAGNNQNLTLGTRPLSRRATATIFLW